MSFFKKMFSKKEKKQENEKQRKPIPRSGLNQQKVPPQKQVSPTGMHVKIARIDKIMAPKSISSGEELEIIIRGSFSDAGWKIKDISTEIKGFKIIVIVHCQKKAGTMAAMVITPYSSSVKIKNLQKGSYSIIAANNEAVNCNVDVI